MVATPPADHQGPGALLGPPPLASPASSSMAARLGASFSKETVASTRSNSPTGRPDSRLMQSRARVLVVQRGALVFASGRKARSHRASARCVDQPVDHGQPQVGHAHLVGVGIDDYRLEAAAGLLDHGSLFPGQQLAVIILYGPSAFCQIIRLSMRPPFGGFGTLGAIYHSLPRSTMARPLTGSLGRVKFNASDY